MQIIAKEAPVRGSLKLLWHIIVVASVVVATALVAISLLAPAIVESALEDELRSRGLPDARFEVRHVGLRHATIDGLDLGANGRLSAKTVTALYSVRGLLRGEIETLRIVGAKWVVRLRGRRLDLGPVDALLEGQDESPEGGRLPVERIVLLASDVIVAAPTQRWRIPVEGVLERTPDGFRARVSATHETIPVSLVAEVRQRPTLEADVLVAAGGSGPPNLQLQGRLASDGSIHVRSRGSEWSTDAVLAGRRVVANAVSWTGRAIISREPLAIEALQLAVSTDAMVIGDQRVESLHMNASAVGETIGLHLAWVGTTSRGAVALAGLPTRLSPEHLQESQLSWQAAMTVESKASTLTLFASAESSVTRDPEEDVWTLHIDEGRLEAHSELLAFEDPPIQLRGLRANIAFEGTVSPGQVVLAVDPGSSMRAKRVHGVSGDEGVALEDPRLEIVGETGSTRVRVGGGDDGGPDVAATIEIAGRASAVTAAGMRAPLRELGVALQARRAEGSWEVRGRSELRLAPVTHAKSSVRIERVLLSLPVRYPVTQDFRGPPGRVRVGPAHWRGATFPAIRGTVVQRGDGIAVALRWPLTADVAVRARGRIGLTEPLGGFLEITAPPFALDESAAVVAVAEEVLGGSLNGEAAFTGEVALRDGVVTQGLRVQLDDVSVSRGSKSPQALHGIAGTIELDSVVPPASQGRQRLRWKNGRIGKLMLSAGHVDFALQADRTVLVEEIATDLADRIGGGRLFVGAFRYAPDQKNLRLDLFAEALGLQYWLELLTKGEVTGTGTLHGHVTAILQLDPRLRLHLDDGVLLAEPGGTLAVKDIRTAQAVLGSTGAGSDARSLPRVVKQRLLEAVQNLRFSTLRFKLIEKRGGVTLQAYVAGRGTRGARQEIGGLTVNVNGFEEAFNQVLRLRGGLKEIDSRISEEVSNHAPSSTPP